MNKVCIYPGRFQPFTSNHYNVYKYLVSKFGKNNVFIISHDSKGDDQKSPFTGK